MQNDVAIQIRANTDVHCGEQAFLQQFGLEAGRSVREAARMIQVRAHGGRNAGSGHGVRYLGREPTGSGV